MWSDAPDKGKVDQKYGIMALMKQTRTMPDPEQGLPIAIGSARSIRRCRPAAEASVLEQYGGGQGRSVGSNRCTDSEPVPWAHTAGSKSTRWAAADRQSRQDTRRRSTDPEDPRPLRGGSLVPPVARPERGLRPKRLADSTSQAGLKVGLTRLNLGRSSQ